MNTRTSLFALTLALAVNTAAVGALHQGMHDGVQRAQLAAQEPARIVVSAKRAPTELAQCPGVSAL